jgi:hypothetical protein
MSHWIYANLLQDVLRQDSAKEVAELQRRYPIGNHPLFPDKRIYAKGGLFWDLSPVRLDVWAAAIVWHI